MNCVADVAEARDRGGPGFRVDILLSGVPNERAARSAEHDGPLDKLRANDRAAERSSLDPLDQPRRRRSLSARRLALFLRISHSFLSSLISYLVFN